ncbi:hypothetical protein [Estrella lausannensis]|uniref:Uncharacterized protein n=1 Tax=Estrella lausannensis TaxID=483423 RepID=A0A0H5DRS8_9BACT|nr:hypothetical protein [Estrella lausannensis]CRX38424.1 hypothetical protein ELAC_1080 [Estrella lausannensis]
MDQRSNPAVHFRQKAAKSEWQRFNGSGSFASVPEELLAILLFLKEGGQYRECALTRLDKVMSEDPLPVDEDPYFALRAAPPVAALLQAQSLGIRTAVQEKLRAYLLFLGANLQESMRKEGASLSRFLRIRIELTLSIAAELLGDEGALQQTSLSIDDFFHPQLSPDLFTLLFTLEAVGRRHVGQDLLQSLRLVWSDEQGTFLGPPLCSFHEGALPSVQRADFWMSCLTGTLGEKLKRKAPPLESALYPDKPFAFPSSSSMPASVPSIADNWINPTHSLFTYRRGDLRLKPYWRAFHLVRGFISGNGPMVSFSVQGKVEGEVAVSKDGLAVQVRFSYTGEQVGVADPTDLIGFYVGPRSGIEYTVNDCRSTVFNLGDILSFKGGFGEIQVVFSQISGTSTVCGHMTAGARPAVECGDGVDWVAYLRPVKLEAKSDFLMTISVK